MGYQIPTEVWWAKGGPGHARLEAIRGAYAKVTSFPKVREPSAPPEELPDAHIRWGKESEFNSETIFRRKARVVGVGLGDDDDEEPPERERLTFSEEGRAWEDLRIENPDDPEQYGIMRVTVGAVFRAPNGAQHIYQFNSQASHPGLEEGSGQTPPAPPELEEIP